MDYHSFDLYLLQVRSVLSAAEVFFLIILCLIFMTISAISSGGEVALFSLNDKDLNMLKARENNNSRLIPAFLERPRMLMNSLLITTTVSNIVVIFILNYLLSLLVNAAQYMVLSLFVRIIIISFVLLLCCEILPRTYAIQNKYRMALFAAPLLRGLLDLLEPLSNTSTKISDWLSDKLFRRKQTKLSTADIDQAIHLSLNRSASREETNILRSIINFGQITVKQIMCTRMDVSGIEYNTTFKSLINKISHLHYSRLPVYQGNLDNISGIVHTKDLLAHLKDKDHFDWHSVIRPPYFVPEQKLIEDLLNEFQLQRNHFAVVVDEFGGTSGIVTLDDIMEEIIGDIRDEFDEGDYFYSKINDHDFIFEGKTMLNDVCRILDIPSDTFEEVKGESDSLGGLILEIAGVFPEVNQPISYKNFNFTPLGIHNMRIQKIKVTITLEERKNN